MEYETVVMPTYMYFNTSAEDSDVLLSGGSVF